MIRYKKTGAPIVNADKVETAPLRESHNIPVQQDNGNAGSFQRSNDGLVDTILVFRQFQRGKKNSGHCLPDVTNANLPDQFRIRFAALVTKITPEKRMALPLGQASQLAADRLKNLSAAEPGYQ